MKIRTNVSVIEVSCGLACDGPNYSSVLFDLHGDSTSNKFGTLSDVAESSSSSIDTFNSSDHQALAQRLYSSSPAKPCPKPGYPGRPLRIINVNCQSLVNKTPLFHNLVESSKPDIIVATETWFTSQIHDAEYFNLDHYSVYRRDRRTDTSGGGVIIAVNKEYNSSHEEDLEKDNVEMIWVKVIMKGCKQMYVGGCYRAKVDDGAAVDALEDCLQTVCGRSNSPVLLAGDFISPGWYWSSNTVKGNCTYPNLHNRFMDIVSDNGLSQIVDAPTRQGNILDLIITNRPSQVNRTQSLPGIADHDVVYN